MFQNKKSNLAYFVIASLLFFCIVLCNGCCWKGCERDIANSWHRAFTYEEYQTYLLIENELAENGVVYEGFTLDQMATHEMVRMNLECNNNERIEL